MDPKRPTIAEWQRFGTYTVLVYNQDLGVNVEAYVSKSSLHIGFSHGIIGHVQPPQTPTAIQTHRDGIKKDKGDDVNKARLYELLAATIGVAIKDFGIIQRKDISPDKLREENNDLADRILRDARAYQILYPPSGQ